MVRNHKKPLKAMVATSKKHRKTIDGNGQTAQKTFNGDGHIRPAQIAELPRSKFDPELFPHSAYVEIFVTFATKVPYLTFCNKM